MEAPSEEIVDKEAICQRYSDSIPPTFEVHVNGHEKIARVRDALLTKMEEIFKGKPTRWDDFDFEEGQPDPMEKLNEEVFEGF